MTQNKASKKSANNDTLKKQHSESGVTSLKNTDDISETGTASLPVPLGQSITDHSVDVLDSLNKIAHKYDIHQTMAQHLLALRDYQIAIVIDDSGSMKTKIKGTQRTRWDELCKIVKIVLEIGLVFDSKGIDVYFINGREYLQVTNPRVIDEAFKIAPRGYTPLVRTLERVFGLPATRRGHDRKLLVFVATDGAPTDADGNETVSEFERVMGERRVRRTYVSFLLCTDDPTYVKYMNECDQTMQNVDVTDDFQTEKETIQKYRGEDYPFSFGDYVVKALVGAIDPEIDKINEP